ncbi:MAG: hypothetical protein LBT18_02985 [Endomicrobium sp.]|jgi:hypothetical protein|nr:hypothetical protein [Endomicrobium sp.]
MDFKTLSFHHIGIPIEKSKIGKGAKYSPLYKMYTKDGKNNLGLHIQYHAFDEGSSLNKRIQTNVHIAFKTKNIEKSIEGYEVVMPLYEPFKGYKCACIIVNDTLIEIIETQLPEEQIWNDEETLNNGILYKK